jgi:hypothetical protein
MSATHMGATPPTDILEVRAAEQRRRIHASVLELRSKLEEKLDVRKKATDYVWQAAGAAVVLGLLLGYGGAGIFAWSRR